MSEKFTADLDQLLAKISKNVNPDIHRKLQTLRDRLVSLRLRNIAKINHSVMELICAKHLITAGYDVDVERPIDNISCDIFATKGFGSLIVEVETGFIPPDHALDPLTYVQARIASKITRYSDHAEKFSLAGPPHYVMQIPQIFVNPPRYRRASEIQAVKMLCDRYYKRPAVTLPEIRNARLHTIYIIDVDNTDVKETDPLTYAAKTNQWAF